MNPVNALIALGFVILAFMLGMIVGAWLERHPDDDRNWRSPR